MLELFSKLFWPIAKNCVPAPVLREIFQIAFKSNFVCIVWSIGFQASRTKREPRAEIGGRGCMQGARPVIRADYSLIPIQNLNVQSWPLCVFPHTIR
nr:MAG TPA: hypothetical protein [Caudoviricetes sp.]